MANELEYQSAFTGEQMDARFTAVATLTAALEELTAVVAGKYVKPADGIPSTDMTAAVQASLAKAESAVQSLADYYTKAEVDQLLAAINGMDYVDVSTLPTASASTMGKIYLVGPNASGYYSYYYTSYNGSAYSWVGPLGTTEISLANYATKTELGQLDQKFVNLSTSNPSTSGFVKEVYVYGSGVDQTHTYGIRVIYNGYGTSGYYSVYLKDFTANTNLGSYSARVKPSASTILDANDATNNVFCKIIVNFDALADTLYNPANVYFTKKCFSIAESLNINRDDIEKTQNAFEKVVEDGVAQEASVVDDFVTGYYLPRTATSLADLSENSNLMYKVFALEDTCTKIFVQCGYQDNYSSESLAFLDAQNNVVSVHAITLAGAFILRPNGVAKVCVSFLKNYSPHVIKVYTGSLSPTDVAGIAEDVVGNEISDVAAVVRNQAEITLRDSLFELGKRSPFEWKTFNKKWVAFMTDDANTDMCDYYAVFRSRRIPYCPAFILDRYQNYTYAGNDADRTNIVKCPAIGQEYTSAKLSTQTYLRLYFDRQYSGGFPVVVTINGTDYEIASPDNARISIGGGTSITFTVKSVANMEGGYVDFLNIIATADSADNVSTSATWTMAETIKNIVFDFGEILSHASTIINMWDAKEAELLLAEYIYGIPKKIRELVGENCCHGAILPGGTNSDRWQHTELGEKYCGRYLLYADNYGTSPQYSIVRTSYRSIVPDTITEYAAAKTAAATWLASKNNGFYPLFGHSEVSPTLVGAIVDAALEDSDVVCSSWFDMYHENS